MKRAAKKQNIVHNTYLSHVLSFGSFSPHAIFWKCLWVVIPTSMHFDLISMLTLVIESLYSLKSSYFRFFLKLYIYFLLIRTFTFFSLLGCLSCFYNFLLVFYYQVVYILNSLHSTLFFSCCFQNTIFQNIRNTYKILQQKYLYPLSPVTKIVCSFIFFSLLFVFVQVVNLYNVQI